MAHFLDTLFHYLETEFQIFFIERLRSEYLKLVLNT